MLKEIPENNFSTDQCGYKTVIKLIVAFVLFAISSPLSWANGATDSVVKIFVTSNSMDYYRPWQSKGIEAASKAHGD